MTHSNLSVALGGTFDLLREPVQAFVAAEISSSPDTSICAIHTKTTPLMISRWSAATCTCNTYKSTKTPV